MNSNLIALLFLLFINTLAVSQPQNLTINRRLTTPQNVRPRVITADTNQFTDPQASRIRVDAIWRNAVAGTETETTGTSTSGSAIEGITTLNQNSMTPAPTRKRLRFTVTDRVADTSVRIAAVEGFRLQPEEKKAVALTGTTITKLDRSVGNEIKNNPSGAQVYMLPEIYYAKTEGTNVQVSYRILFIDSAPLIYDFGRQLFEGKIRFLPLEVTNTENSHPVQKSLSVAEDIFVSYGMTSVPLSIRQINWPPLDVTVTSPNPVDSLEVKVLTVSNPLGYSKSLRVEPAIILSSARTTIQGLGIQTLPIHVALKGVTSYKPVPVTVETSLGSIDSASFTLTNDRIHEVTLRSENIGRINIKVVNPNYVGNSIIVESVFPWLFLLMAILGGMIGGLGKILLGKQKITLRRLALGSILGLIAAVAYWGLGIVLIGFSLETRGLNEAMVFGLALLAGYFGLIGIKKEG